MKRIIGILLALTILWTATALAAEALPPGLTEVWNEAANGAMGQTITFETPDGRTHAFILTQDGWGLYGYVLEDGQWRGSMSGWAMEGYQDLSFERHSPQTLRPDGTPYPDDLGFDLVSAGSGARLSYQYEAPYFQICGWYDPEHYAGKVMVRGTCLEYYAPGENQPEAVVDAQEMLLDWITFFDQHPATPERARELSALLERNVAGRFEGYTLLSCWHASQSTDAVYARLTGTTLEVKRALFAPGGAITQEIDLMPLPLSQALSQRLAGASLEALLSDGSLTDDFYLEDGALDTGRIPVTDSVVEADLQAQGLILLTQDAQGARKVSVVTYDEAQDRYVLQAQTPALPQRASLDTAHSTENELIVNLDNHAVSYRGCADGLWRMDWDMGSSESGSFSYAVSYCGIEMSNSESEEQKRSIGSFGMLLLNDLNPDALPNSAEQARALVDATGWAAVNNPDPADRLHLRAAANREAESLGKFYNGTPVQVLERQSDWARVNVGVDGLEGWMMASYLAFGEDANQVAPAFPQLIYREERETCGAYRQKDLKEPVSLDAGNGGYAVVGVVDDELYILLTDLGDVGYVPQEWMWEGNG